MIQNLKVVLKASLGYVKPCLKPNKREERTKVDSQWQLGRGLHSDEDGILAFLTERDF